VQWRENIAAAARSPIGAARRDWPSAEKEFLGHCPICKSAKAQVMYDGLRDGAFGVPGAWTLRRCSDCAVAYLDPRPTLASIGAAYSTYYTHQDIPFKSPAQGLAVLLSTIVQSIIEVRDLLYVKFIWPHDAPIGRIFRPMFEKLAPRPIAAVACKLRHLQPAAHDGACLLDIGCGDGAFLPTAERLGYAAVGIEPDPVAVQRGVAKGRRIRHGTLEANGLPADSFDHITLSHVLEHFHDPVAALDEVCRLLRPGGRVWITQPNLGSLGLVEFGSSWRGLEPPRHMVLMTPNRLIELLQARGFVRVEHKSPPYEAVFYFHQSLAIREGEDPNRGRSKNWSRAWRAKARAADAAAFADPAFSESMTVVGYKR
jgi:SAM-dependent methyltransferase